LPADDLIAAILSELNVRKLSVLLGSILPKRTIPESESALTIMEVSLVKLVVDEVKITPRGLVELK
jgi:hypothetical protein